jgi:hypothetical protein
MAQRRQELEKELVGLAQKGAFALIAQNLEEYEYFVRSTPHFSLGGGGDTSPAFARCLLALATAIDSDLSLF